SLFALAYGFFRALAFGDVQDHAADSLHAAVGRFDRIIARQPVALYSRLARGFGAYFEVHKRTPRLDHPLENRFQAISHFGRHFPRRATERTVHGSPVNFRHRFIETHIPELPIEQGKADWRRLVDILEFRILPARLLLALAQRLFSHFQIVNVGEGSEPF